SRAVVDWLRPESRRATIHAASTSTYCLTEGHNERDGVGCFARPDAGSGALQGHWDELRYTPLIGFVWDPGYRLGRFPAVAPAPFTLTTKAAARRPSPASPEGYDDMSFSRCLKSENVSAAISTREFSAAALGRLRPVITCGSLCCTAHRGPSVAAKLIRRNHKRGLP